MACGSAADCLFLAAKDHVRFCITISSLIETFAVPNLVEIRDLHFSYGERPILSGLRMDFPRGKVVAVMGGSGSRQDDDSAPDRRPA